MKAVRSTLMTTVSAALIILLVSSSVFAANSDQSNLSPQVRAKAIIGYRYSLTSDNPGVRQWSVIYCHRYHLAELTTDLVTVLFNDPYEEVRIAAAVALIDIGGDEGRKAVATASKSTEFTKLARFCSTLLESKIDT
jgi:hypothetical protein